MKKFCFLSLLCLCGCASRPPGAYTSNYALDFQPDSVRMAQGATWWAEAGRGYGALHHSPLRAETSADGSFAMSCHSVPRPGGSDSTQVLRLALEQHLLLPPEARMQPVEVALRCRGEALKGVTLTATLVDFAEQTVSTGRTAFVPGEAMESHAVTLPAHAAADALWLGLEVTGRDGQPSEIGLEGVDIRLGGQPLDDYALRQPVEVRLTAHPGPASQLWPSLAGARIVALGRSTAWSGREAVAAAAAIGEDVRRGRTRAVVVDRPMEDVFALARYVDGRTAAWPSVRPTDEALRPLLDTLRACNQAAGEVRVRLRGGGLGVNLGVRESTTGAALFDFLTAANATAQSPAADLLAAIVYEEGPAAAGGYWTAHPKALDGVLTEDEQADLRHVLSLWQQLPADLYAQAVLRDSVVAVNVRYVSERYAEGADGRTVVYGLNTDANPSTAYPLTTGRTWGHRLAETYGKEYAAVAVTSEGGQKLGLTPGEAAWAYRDVEPAPAGSLERALGDATRTTAFAPQSALPDAMVLMRSLGDQPGRGGYSPCNPHGRYAGVLFVGRDVPEPVQFVDPARLTDADAMQAAVARRTETLQRIRESATYRAYKAKAQ